MTKKIKTLILILIGPLLIFLIVYLENRLAKKEVENFCNESIIGKEIPSIKNLNKKYIVKNHDYLIYGRFILVGTITCTLKIKDDKIIDKRLK